MSRKGKVNIEDDWDRFCTFCADNDLDPDDDDSWGTFAEAMYEDAYPYLSRGLSESDFL